MDEDTLPADENEEEFRKMEKDIDEFLSNIRENVSKNFDPQSEATCSGVYDEFDSISSDDLELESKSNCHSLRSGSDEPGFKSRARKFNHASSSKNRRGRGQQKGKGRGVHKQRQGSSREEHHSSRGRGRKLGSGDEHDQYRSRSSSRRNNDHPLKISPPKEGDEYHWSLSPGQRDEFHQERNLSSRGSANPHERSLSPRGSDEVSLSPEESDNHQGERLHSRGRYRYKRGKFSLEGIEEHSQDSYIFNENFSHPRTSGSRSSETESIYHRIYAEESDSSAEYENHDYDYGDQNSDPSWKRGEDDPFMAEDDDDQSSSIITACLESVIAANPEIAQKISIACMALFNKSDDRTCDSDYEHEESSCSSFVDQSGRVSPRSWRDSRSHNFSKSPGSSSGPSGSRHYRNRCEDHSQRIVVEYSHSPSPEPGHSSDDRVKEARYSSGYDKKSPAAATSHTFSTKKRSHSNHHKNDYEEDAKTSVSRSIRKIKKQCEEESDSTVRRALLALLKVHQRECDMYLRKTEAHPDYNKEYKVFLDKKSRSIIDLGGDPNEYDFQEDWKKYWPTQISRLFRESWDAKMHKCTSMLQRKGHLSKSLHASTKKHVVNPPPEKKQKTSKCESEIVNTEKNQKKSDKAKSPEEQLGLQAVSTAKCKVTKEEMDTKILSILKLLSHIKHKFKGCEASFDSFYQKALNLKQSNSDVSDVLQGNLPLLIKIDASLRETLQDEKLTMIQKAIIQETHERFQCFLEKSKEIDSHSLKNNDNTLGKGVKICKSSNITGKIPETFVSSATTTDEKEKNQIPCYVTDLHPSVVTSVRTEQVTASYACMCCDTNQKVCRPMRTLTEISIQGSSGTESGSPNKPKDDSTSASSFPSTKKQDGKQFTCKSYVTSTEEESDMTQPSPPGVTPPPLGVTPPPPGVVTTPPPGVTPPPPSVTLPLPGVTPPLGVTLSPTANVTSPCVTSPPPLSVTPPPPGVTPPPSLSPPSHSVTSPLSSITPPPHVKSPPHTATPPHSSDTSTPLSITAPLPGVTLPPASLVPQSLGSTLSQSPTSQSLLVSNLQVSSGAGFEATKHPSTISTSVIQNSKFVNYRNIIPISQINKVQQPSKEFLRSTIRDCFVSVMSPSKERSVVDTSTAEDPITLDSKTEESAVSSMPSLPEDLLRMFVVKLEDNSEIAANCESIAKMSSSGNNAENDTKPVAKKPIKITIPQFSKRKSVPAFNPIVDDDQELL